MNHRSERVADALCLYHRELGEGGPVGLDTLRDLTQDAIHWIAEQGTSDPCTILRGIVASAIDDYPNECD